MRAGNTEVIWPSTDRFAEWRKFRQRLPKLAMLTSVFLAQLERQSDWGPVAGVGGTGVKQHYLQNVRRMVSLLRSIIKLNRLEDSAAISTLCRTHFELVVELGFCYLALAARPAKPFRHAQSAVLSAVDVAA